jgi:hypothetical protein
MSRATPAAVRLLSRHRRRLAARLFLCAALSLSGQAAPLTAGEGDNDDATSDGSPSSPAPDALKTVRLNEQQRKAAGIEVIGTRRAQIQPELAVQGKIVDISPLLELRARYRAALSEFRIAEATSALARQNRDRLATLSQEAIIANKELVRADSELTAAQVRTGTTRQRLGEIREEALHSWGPELFRLAVEGESSLWDRLLSRREALLLIALPANTELPAGTRQVYVARNRDRQHAARAEFLAPAPNTDNFVQGETYFFHVDASRLRTGMRVDAWIATSGGRADGAFVPASAIVWPR